MEVPSFELLKLLVSSIAVPFGVWVLNRLSKIENALDDHRLYSANNYQKKSEMQDFKKEMREMLGELKRDLHKAVDEIKADQKEPKAK
ncbi:hypothetical protein OF381_10500 [Mannheimia haemolytica]